MAQAAEQLGWSAHSTAGVVAGGGAGAVAGGLALLQQDGNAADAAVATILALNVTDHGACSIGGEVPLLIYDAQGSQGAKRSQVKALSGQGRAPLAPEAIDWYMRNGIPGDGDIKMAPVPAVVDLCVTTLQRYGTKSFAEVVAPALGLLGGGSEEWQPKLADTLQRLVEQERATTGTREAKLQAVSDRFYGRGDSPGDIADQLEAYYIERGGFLRRRDLAAHVTTVEDAVTVDYRGYTVCKCGPWTQGPYLLQALRLLEGFDVAALEHLSADYVHVVIEALKLAMADRDAYYGDPEHVEVPLDQLLSAQYAAVRRPLIDLQQASPDARPGDPYTMAALGEPGVFRAGVGGTTTCVVADRWGNVVAATPSANVPREPRDGGQAGVTFGNRLRSLNTTPGHPNCIAPGKRPRITLTPSIVLHDGVPAMAISVAGGDRQDQVALQLLLDVIEFGQSPDTAVKTPRFFTNHHQDSFDPDPDRERAFKSAGSLAINDTVPAAVRDELARRGHRVEVHERHVASPCMLMLDAAGGEMQAAGDPAAGRHAGGL